MKDETGKRYGRLLVLSRAKNHQTKSEQAHWNCLCDCGNKTISAGNELRSGNTKSCGCFSHEKLGLRARKHGLARSRFYRIFYGIKSRCNNPKNPKYGGRGIKCFWRTFQAFKNDMQIQYLDHCGKYGEIDTTIERMNNNLDYCKENCRWATRNEQAKNKRNNRWLSFNGEKLHLMEWERRTGISHKTLRMRLKSGWSEEKTLTTPLMVKGVRQKLKAQEALKAL